MGVTAPGQFRCGSPVRYPSRPSFLPGGRTCCWAWITHLPVPRRSAGLASGGQEQGGNALFLGDRVHHSGAVGVALHGNIAVDTVVAQGCRPIGKPMRITQSRRNLLEGLDGESPLTVLRGLFPTLSQRDQGLMRNSLFLGVVMDDFIDEPQQGDFLIRT